MVDDRTNNIETRTLFDDVLKTSKSASQFGPVRVFRVPEKPVDSFGRNGDLCIIDNTAVSSIEIAIEQCPTNVGFCQKIPANVPGGPNRAASIVNGADLVGNDSFTINGTSIVLPAGSVFVKDAADAINAAAIPGMNAIGLTTSAPGTVVAPYALPGYQIIINGVTVTFAVNGGTSYIASQIDAASIPFILVSTLGDKITITHTRGGEINLGGANLIDIMGTPTVSGGTMSLTNEDGTTVTLVDVTGIPLATMGFPLTIPNSPLVCGGTWQCFDANGIEIKDHGNPLGTFDTIDFIGAGVTVTDGGGGELIVDIPGGGSGSTQNLWETIAADSGSVTASSPTDTLNIIGGVGISTAVSGNTVTVTNTGGTLPPGFTLSSINGQPVLTIEDATRTNKDLSVTDQPIIFSENRLGNLDWLQIGNANDADSGYISDLDGTLVYVSAHCENTGASSKDIHLFVNSTDMGSIGTLGGGTNVTFVNTTLDVDVLQGDRIRLRAVDGILGNIQDTVVKLTIKWRA